MKTRLAPLLALVLIILAVIGTYVPWGWHQNASLSPGARDLAEWTTLYPPYHAENPALLPSLLIRASLGLLAVIAAQYALLRWPSSKTHALAGLGMAILVVLTLLPPAEYLRDRGNPNYSQMAGIALGSGLICGIALVGIARLPLGARRLVFLVTCLGAALLGVLGIQRAFSLFEVLGTPLNIGIGAVLFLGALGGLAVLGFGVQASDIRSETKS